MNWFVDSPSCTLGDVYLLLERIIREAIGSVAIYYAFVEVGWG